MRKQQPQNDQPPAAALPIAMQGPPIDFMEVRRGGPTKELGAASGNDALDGGEVMYEVHRDELERAREAASEEAATLLARDQSEVEPPSAGLDLAQMQARAKQWASGEWSVDPGTQTAAPPLVPRSGGAVAPWIKRQHSGRMEQLGARDPRRRTAIDASTAATRNAIDLMETTLA
jgi:hypothetical protein